MLSAISLSSCELAKNQLTFDRGNNQEIQDYRDGLSPEHKPAAETSGPMPEFQSVVSTPADLKLPSPLVTVSVNQTVSLHDLMFELTEQAGIDLEMDPNVHGSLIFTAKDRPFNDVVERICSMAGLRYTFKNNVLRIELDRPYLKEYKVDYMSIARKSASSITTGISASGSGSGAGATSTKSGSDAKVENANDSDFWKDIDAGLSQLLTSSDTYAALASQDDPVAVAEPPPPMTNPDGTPAPPSNLPPSLNVSAAPAGVVAKSAPASYSISKQTGVVGVFASERQQKLVQKFLDNYRRQAMTQVLIEAKVLEVDLNDQYEQGIDWGAMNFPAPGFVIPGTSADALFRIGVRTKIDNANYKSIISALSQFGTVRALSSPRVTVMNNQSAVVNVAENLIYFNITVTVTPATGLGASPTITYNSTQQSTPAGVLLNVTPTVNPDTGEIMLALRPTVTKEIDTVNDPSVALSVLSGGGTLADVPNSPIPEMSVQEIDSIVKMQSGQTMVMGGLMKDANSVTQTGVPVLGDLPGIGALFRNHQDQVQKSELVIFIKASILPGSNVDETDRKVYKQFGDDSRPFQM